MADAMTQTQDPAATAAVPVKLGWLDYMKMLFNGRAAVETALNEGKLVASQAHTSGVRSLAFWATALTSAAAVGAQAGGLIPPPYGAIVLAASTLFYSIGRGIGKSGDATAGLKPALATSEVWANILAAVGQVAMSATGAVDPKTASVLAAVHAGAIAVSQGLAASGAQPEAGIVVTNTVDPDKA